MVACAAGDVVRVASLLNSGADVKTRTGDGIVVC